MDWMYAAELKELPNNIEEYFPAISPAPHHNAPPKLGMQIVSSGPDTALNTIKNGMLEMLFSAQECVYLQTPYFTPDDSFLGALRIAAQAGVDVRLMIPELKDHMLVHDATLSYARQAIAEGVRVFMYRGFLHAKTAVVDSKAVTIGTTNIGTRSFALNFEVNAFIYDRHFSEKCKTIFLTDQTNCLELTEEWFTSRSLIKQAYFGLSRLFAPLM